MSENTGRFNNESEQMPLDATEASDFLAHSITSRLQRMPLSPWLQRALQSDSDSNEGGGGILGRLGARRTTFSTQHTFTLLNRMEQVSDRSIVWHANVGSTEQAIEGFTDKIAGRFPTTEGKYLVQKSEEAGDQAKPTQGSEMIFADYGGASPTPTTDETGQPTSRRGSFDVNSLPEIPDHIKAQHIAKQAEGGPASSSPASSGPISLTPSPGGTASKAPVAKRPLTPEERRKMRLYSRVEYVTPGSSTPDTPSTHPLADRTQESASTAADAPVASSPMPELPPGLTPVSEPVEEPKWRTRPRARVDYVSPRGDTPKSAEESDPAPTAAPPTEAVQAEPIQRQAETDEELTLRPRPRHRETPENEGEQGEIAAQSAMPSPTPTPAYREEQPTPPSVPSEETIPQAAQPRPATPRPAQDMPATPPAATEQVQFDTPPASPVVVQRTLTPQEAEELPLHPRQRQRGPQEEDTPEVPLSASVSQAEASTSPIAEPSAIQRESDRPGEPESKRTSSIEQVERPGEPESKRASSIEQVERPRPAVETTRTEERPTLTTPTVQREGATDQPLDMPLRPRARATSIEQELASPEAASDLVAPSTDVGETARQETSHPAARAQKEAAPRSLEQVEAKDESPRPIQRLSPAPDEAVPSAPVRPNDTVTAQPIQRQAIADEGIDLPLRPRTRPRKVQPDVTDTPAVAPTPTQATVPTEGSASTNQVAAADTPAVAATPAKATAPTKESASRVQRESTETPTVAATPSQTEAGTKSTVATALQSLLSEAETAHPTTQTPTAPAQVERSLSEPSAAVPIQRQAEKPEAFELPLRPRGRRGVAHQVAAEQPDVEQAGSLSEQPVSLTPTAQTKEPARPATQRPATPTTVQRDAAESTTSATPVQRDDSPTPALPSVAPTQPTERLTSPVAIERQAETFEVPDLPLRVRPRPQAAQPDELPMVAQESVVPHAPVSQEAPRRAAPPVEAAAEGVAEAGPSEVSAPTPVRAPARKSSSAQQKAVQRKVASAPQGDATPKAPTIQRQPTRAQAMPLRPRRRGVMPTQLVEEASQPASAPTARPTPPTVRRAEVAPSSQEPMSQPVRVQRRVKSAKPALPLRARTPQRVIFEAMDGAEERVASASEPHQPVSVQPPVAMHTEAPTVQRLVESTAAAPDVSERPTVPPSPTRREEVQRAERAERLAEPAPTSLPLRAVRRRQPETVDDLAAAPLAEELVARLTAQSQLPLSGPQGARVQRAAQPAAKATPKPALPKATRVQREPARETSKVVAQRARPAIQSHEEATTQLVMAGWRFKRNAGTTVSDPGMISRSLDNLVQRSDTGRPLDTGTRTKMEGALGRDFSQVRVHNVQLSPLNVQAASEGRNVYFEPGQDRFDTPDSLSLLGHELTHVAQAGFAQTKSVVQTAILPQARVQRSEAADEAEADQGERRVSEYLRSPQMAQMMPLVNEASSRSESSSASSATVQRSALSSPQTDMPVVQRAETGGDGGGDTSSTQAEASGGEEGKKDEKDPTEKAKELTKLARQLYPLIKRMLMVERERHSGI